VGCGCCHVTKTGLRSPGRALCLLHVLAKQCACGPFMWGRARVCATATLPALICSYMVS
jgi:hypothetical protein